MSNIVDFDASMLLDIDVDAVYPKFGDTTLKLSDLDNIDWDLVASSVLGITDPIGQIRDWLAGVLSGFFDSIKKFFEGLISPLRDAISSLFNTIKSVVVDPILSALKWISDNFFKLAGAVSDLVSKVVDTITKLPDYVRGFIDSVSRVFGDLVDRVRSGFSWFIDQVAKIPDFLRGLVENISRVLGDLAGKVREGFSWFIEQVAKLPDTIRDLAGKVAGFFSDLADKVKAGFSWFLEQVGKIPDFLRDLMGKAAALFGDLADKIRGGFTWFIEQVSKIPDFIRGLIEGVGRFFADLSEKIKSGFAWFIEQVSKVPDMIRDLAGKVAGFFGDLADKVRSGFAWFLEQLSKIPDIVRGLVEGVGRFFSDLAERVKAGFSWFIDQVAKLPDTIRDLFGKVAGVIGDLLDRVRAGFAWFIEQVGKIPDFVRGVAEKVAGALADLAEKAGRGLATLLDLISKAPSIIKDTLTTILGDVAKGIGGVVEWVRRGFEGVAGTLSSWFESARGWFEAATGALRQLGSILTGFVNAVMQLPERLKAMFDGVVKFFENLWTGLQEFIKDPAKWLSEHVVAPLWSGLQWLGGKIWEGLQWLWQRIVEGAGWLWSTLKTAGEWLVNALRGVYDALHGFFVGVADAIGKAGEAIYGFFVNAFSRLADTVKGAVESVVKPVISEFMKAVGWGSPPGLTIGNFAGAWVTSFAWSIPLYGFALAMEIPLRAIAFAMRGIAMAMRDLNWKIRLSLKPLGIGAETEVDVAKAIGAALYNFSEEIMKHVDKFYEPFWMGVGLWYGRYASMLLTYNLRNFIPIEMPSFREAEELWNRIRSTALASFKIPEGVVGTPKDAEEAILNFLKIRGYSDYILKLAFADENEFYLEIEDRFGTKRRIPLADAWRVPPPSDIVRLMIRDVIIDPKYFAAVMRMQGFNKDTAIMYYYLHYRYPSPERLAEFYWRGLAGVLWYPDALFEADLAGSLGIKVSARAPRELNFDAKSLNDAISKYMKWHDYAPFPWVDKFTTDKAIVTELMADLPDKADFRWLTRWGILEHLSKLGVGVTTAIDKIIDAISSARGDELLSKQVAAGISLDVSLLSRFLVARGVHPYFATIASVADAHTMLADEMTLLRSGFLNIYRWGMSDINTLEQLMSGLITIQFTTAYLDLAKGAWTTLTYNKPVLWLPAERRLLQLRSAIDRYYELWRDYVREVERGVRTLALLSRSDVESVKKYVGQLKLPEDVAGRVGQLLGELEETATSEDLLREYYEVVSARLSSEVKAITGRDIAFAIDQAYIDTWIKYAELTRVIEARHWVRTFATRIMGWLFYRVSYGWVSPDEMKSLTTMLLARGWMSVEEKEFLDVVAEWVYRVAVKELVPSPSTLASLAEYMVIDVKVVEDALSKYNVPREYWDLWKTYIAVKPVKADYKAVLNTALKALRYTAISRDYYESLLKSAEAYGFTPAEINLVNLRSELELLIDEAKLWRPTLLTLISMVEYVPEAVKLLEYYKVDPVFKPIIERYALVKPLADEVRILVNSLYRAKRYVAIPREIEDKALSIAKQFGVTDMELAVRDLALELQALVDEAKEWAPSPSTLASLSEYVVLPKELVESALKTRHVPEEWASVWLQYISVKPVKADYKAVLMTALKALRYNAVTREYWDALLKAAGQYGFTPLEVSLTQLRAELELMIEEARQWRPTLLTLITISEYVPDAVKLLEYYKVDPLFRPIIEKYALAKPLADEIRTLVSALYRAKRYVTIPKELEDRVLSIVKQFGVTDTELMIRDMALELQTLVDEAKTWMPTPSTLATLSEYITLPSDLVMQALKTRRVPDEWISIWMQYITVKPVKADYKAVISTALRALRYKAITEEQWKKILEDARKYGFTDPEIALTQFRAELELAIEEAGEYVPTPSTLATMAEYLPEVRDYIAQVFEARRIRGVWAEVWTKYIYLRPVYDNVRQWASAMFTLAEYLIIDVKQLEPVFKVLMTYGWEELEVTIATRTILAEQVRHAFNNILGAPRTIAGMARYTDKAADWAYSRAVKLIDALPLDNASKELLKQMWREYIMSYQAYPEIRSYMTELINCYATGVLDDTGLEQELNYLRKIGVPEMRLALVKRTAMLRRARYSAASE
jgi:phage-related protein